MSLLKCPKCGEMFSDSYKTCPFCEEDEAFANGGKKPVNPGRRVHRQKSPSILGPTLVLVLVLVAGVLVLGTILTLMGIRAAHHPDGTQPVTVIVLGCQVRSDGTPSRMLRDRIQAAYDYLSIHEEAVCVASANDCACALAEHIAGSEEAFVERMNRKAEELGMQETHFVNACGLDVDGHETSAYDIALMSRELMTKFPEIQKYTTTWQDTIIHKTRKGESEFGLTNTNKLIKWYEGATGLKTGSTGKALYCLSGTAERNGMHLIGVVMAAPDFKLRFQETMKLLDYGFANYSAEKGLPAGKEMGRIPVTKGMEDSVSAVVQEEISILLKKDIGGEWETKAELLPAMDAPVAAGEKVGELIYLLHGKEVGRTDLITAEAVEKANINTMLQRMLRQWF